MKKLVALMLVVVSLFTLTLTSCSVIFGGGFSDPVKLGKNLMKKYDDEVDFELVMSASSFEALAEMYDIDEDGVYAVARIDTEDDGEAMVLYFTKSSFAKKTEKAIVEFIEEADLDEDEYTVKRSGKAIYVGSTDLLKAI